MGADWETIRDILYALSERHDAPGGFVEEVQLFFGERGVRALSTHFRRPMRLTATEAAALELGLAILRDELDAGHQAALDRAGQRVRAATTAAVDEPARALRHVVGADDEHARTLRHVAAGNEEPVRASRRSAAGDAESSDPARLAQDEKGTDGTLQSPIRVRYSARIAKWIAAHETGEMQEDGSIVVEHRPADPRWAMRHVLQYGPDAEVLEPAELRDAVVAQLRAIEEHLDTDG